jgi:hypothetical protein
VALMANGVNTIFMKNARIWLTNILRLTHQILALTRDMRRGPHSLRRSIKTAAIGR